METRIVLNCNDFGEIEMLGEIVPTGYKRRGTGASRL